MSASISYTFSPTTTIASSQANQNFSDIVDYLNNTACVTGMVTMWAGAIGSIPTGWQLCNGSGGAPDLRDRFIVGAGNSYSIGNSGGSNNKNIAHTHSFSGTTSGRANYNFQRVSNNYDSTTNENPDHNHTYSGNTSSGGSASLDIRPPYYSLAFIYKT